jgi:cytochrome c oxidase accessory protein FixG
MAAPRPSLESVTTISTDGSRSFLYPADVGGRFTRLRQATAFLLIAFYLSLPWIKIGGFPAAFLDVAERRFHLFGWTFAAQDMWLTFFLITGLGFSLFFVTALLGRVWCGYACPHTVFLDHVYRRIERWIDGDAHARRALAAAPLGPVKLFKRVFKHGLYAAVSLVITHLFLAYFVSLDELWTMMHAQPAEHWSAFVFVFIFAGILYFNFAWFREQLCIVICPYGRLQSALIDDHSLVIGYDAKRGEPRMTLGDAKRLREQAAGAGLPDVDPAKAGDCVACNRCVQVCPTGIDIRQGLQMECVGCTACIDACDDVMTRIHKPRGLIRYDSQTAFAGGKTHWLRPRTTLYGVLLVIGALVAGWALSTLRPANVGITRMTGAPYFVDATSVRNQYLVRLINKRSTPVDFVVSLAAPAGVHRNGLESAVTVAPMGEQVRPLILQVPRPEYAGPFKFNLKVTDTTGSFTVVREVEFLGPDAQLLLEEAPGRRP